MIIFLVLVMVVDIKRPHDQYVENSGRDGFSIHSSQRTAIFISLSKHQVPEMRNVGSKHKVLLMPRLGTVRRLLLLR